MRIGIDGRELFGKPTGVGRYLAQLCEQWAHLGSSSHHFTLYVPDEAPAEADRPRYRWWSAAFDVRRVAGGRGTRWEQTRLPIAVNRDRLDVFFAPAYSAPLALRAPLVLTLPDVSFAAHPEWFGWREGLRRRTLARLCAHKAAVVLTISRHAQREIVEHLGVPPGRIRVTWLAPGRPSAPEAPTEPARIDEATDRLILYVGSIFTRRRLPDLLRTFADLSRADARARLAIVGANRSHPALDLEALVARLGLAHTARIRSWVSDAELAQLYRRARVFAFLSEYEGFGLPPLEAMAAGVPPVVLDTPTAREIYGPAAWRVPAEDRQGLQEALVTLLDNGPRREALLAAAPAVLARYSWARTAEQTLAALEAASRPR